MTAVELKHHLMGVEDKLNAYSMRLTANREDAMDLRQETLMKAFLNLHRLSHGNVQAWLFSIMKNIFINNYRKQQRKRVYMEFRTQENQMFSGSDSGTPLSNYYTAEIREKIDKLDPEYQEPFKLFLRGFKYKEIAENLNLPMGTVKSRIFLGRQILSKSLKDYQFA